MIRSRWTLEQYGDMITSLLERRLDPLDTDSFAHRTPGFWLRHDVELALDAAIQMAQVEADIGVPSTYFVCVESPYFTSDDDVAIAIEELFELGRDVSYHLVLAPDALPIEERLDDLARRFPSVRPEALTFHASGIPVTELARESRGATVYGPLAEDVGSYFSDSTGRWRWGHPEQAILTATDLVQILTHPFWWSGVYVASEVVSDHADSFLPQLATTFTADVPVPPRHRRN